MNIKNIEEIIVFDDDIRFCIGDKVLVKGFNNIEIEAKIEGVSPFYYN